MPDELGEILPYIDKLVDALGVPRLGLEGYEGDDLMATLAVQGRDAGVLVDAIVVAHGIGRTGARWARARRRRLGGRRRRHPRLSRRARR